VKGKKRTKSLAARLLQEQDEERHRIARRLHDSVSQHAAAIQINLSILERLGKTLPPRAAEALASSVELAQVCAMELRVIAGELHPSLLDPLGLRAALQAIAQESPERMGMEIELDAPAQMTRLPPKVEIGLYRVIEQGLVMLRRSGSSAATLRLIRKSETLIVELAGAIARMDPDGIDVLRERVRNIGGKLRVKSTAKRMTYRIELSTSAEF
jgi:two-component system NarL family sensor kinase